MVFTDRQRSVFWFLDSSTEAICYCSYLFIVGNALQETFSTDQFCKSAGFIGKASSLLKERSKRLLNLLETFDANESGFVDEEDLINLISSGDTVKIKQMIDILVSESLALEKIVPEEEASDMSVVSMIGGYVGALDGSLEWVRNDFKPIISNISQGIAAEGKNISDALHMPLAKMAKLEGEKITGENTAEVRLIINEIKSQF